MTTIGDRVREARLAAGLSQTALAGSAFSPSYISLIEAGHREPTDAALGVLAERLGTTPHKLSEVLNAELGQTFYDFVNGYRVRDVQRRIDAGDARQH